MAFVSGAWLCEVRADGPVLGVSTAPVATAEDCPAPSPKAMEVEQQGFIAAACDLPGLAVDEGLIAEGYRSPRVSEVAMRRRSMPPGIVILQGSRSSIELRGLRGNPLVLDGDFYARGLPVLHGCVVRAAAHYFAQSPGAAPRDGAWRTRTVGGRHMGSFVPRKVHALDEEADDVSLHAYGRAIDLRSFQVGGVDFDYQADNPQDGTARRGAESVAKWEEFWVPLRQCLSTGGLASIGPENRRHYTHMHVSMPFGPEETQLRGCATM